MGAGGNDHSKLAIKSDNMHSGWPQKVVSLLTKLGRGAGVWLPLDPWPMVSEDINNIGKLKAYIHYPQITVSVKTKWNNISFVDRALYVCLIFQYSFSTRFLFQKFYEMFLYQVHSTFAGGSKIRKFQPSGREQAKTNRLVKTDHLPCTASFLFDLSSALCIILIRRSLYI